MQKEKKKNEIDYKREKRREYKNGNPNRKIICL